MRLLLLGATGLVGGHVLKQALSNPRIAAIAAPVRHSLPQHPKLDARVVDFDNLPEDPAFWGADAAICALGTTIKAAGSQERFRLVDHDYPLAIASRARAAGCDVFALVSAMGADAGSRVFYSRIKGEIERDILALSFGSTIIARPGLLGGERAERRPLERLVMIALGRLGPVLPKSLRINPAEKVAAAMLAAVFAAVLAAVVAPHQGVTHIRAADMT